MPNEAAPTDEEILEAEDALAKAEQGKSRPRQKELAAELSDLRRRWLRANADESDREKAARRLRVAREQRIVDQEG